ncbi:hypothetical protein E5K00_04905 [Hymenobacter aquaticus]|uniref:Lantibiotic dehydratase n=1 Tax=Hymenobacter aquaticus TaxID=1867101 RepID=A0A4Z0Q4B0_9BACT|nr:lantibiotic dehydratase [Hymenobacter aquaticus]TGE24555.1 hypothetical protein E5K00_04905 [Hymenobacter aquaticus]
MSYSISFPEFIVLRTPLLPFTATHDLSEETLRGLFQNPLLTEALFIASPDFSGAVQQWLAHEPLAPKDRDKLLLSLRKYLLRMAYRCTPYGLFAGISRAAWGPATTLRLEPQRNYVRHTRVDMDYLCSLATTLGQDEGIRGALLYYPNNTLYRVGNQYRYVEYRFLKKTRQHELVTVDHSEFLDTVLQLARPGQPAAVLAQALVGPDISLEEAEEFIAEIIAAQVLVSELEPAVTGTGYLQQLLRVLHQADKTHPALLHLTQLDQQLAALDHSFLGNTLGQYQAIVRGIEQQGPEVEANHLLQVDMLKPTSSHTLGEAVQAELRRTVELLHGLGKHHENEVLHKFRLAFLEQYEQQEVPLLQVLDMEMGIGYPADQQANTDPAPLLHDLPLGSSVPSETLLKWNAWQEFLFEKYLRVTSGQDTHIVLEAADVQPFLTPATTPLPASLYCMGAVLAASTQALDAGEFQVVYQAAAGPSAANLLGRFCHLDPALTADVQAALRAEEAQQPEAVFAEIVHLNQSRIGNISTRPVLRAYEIPILVQAGVDEEHTITLDDLRLSVRGEQLVLRSARLNRQVIPRLSSAHNYSLHALPAYHFLCALQAQHVTPGLSWNWGVLQQAKFLPRVSYGNTILSGAKWRLSKAETEPFCQAPEAGLLAAAHQLRHSRNLPAWIVLTEGDNKLPIQLDSVPHLQVLQAVLKQRGGLLVEECLFQPDNLLVTGPEGAFTNEFIFPLSTQPVVPAPPRAAPAPPAAAEHAPRPARTFFLGSEWLYVKLYCGLQTADTLLTEVVLPLAEQLKEQGIIDNWFFIRYRDTQHHLRVRFHGAGAFYGPVIEALHAALRPYAEANLLFSLRTDTYQREAERYGAHNVVRSEVLFGHDSEATLRILDLLGGQESDQIRWLLALRSVDSLLTDFGRSLEQKRQLLHRLQHNFKEELASTSAAAKKAFGNKYRQVRPQIEHVLTPDLAPDDELAPALAVFAERSRQWAPTIEAILRQEAAGTLEVKLDSLLASYVHMTLNRFFRSKQRLQEAVIYDFLHQHYASLAARTARQLQ